jgi:hypothetical protein
MTFSHAAQVVDPAGDRGLGEDHDLTVASQDVLHIQTTDGWIIAERRVSSVVVVKVEVGREPSLALGRGGVLEPVANSRSRLWMKRSTFPLVRGV